ncbi:uncharacterized protein LOC118187661 [Stegodyphus dumicola]|uniref:uncharacterized protein LOC118187661 n=1 Tax=Stegodyphus dumicola TaxID=202533 RepID=UPI0015ADA2BB|nr:uncharacterized protein LOC118187661 [Stegodyphus dumicola]
MDASSFRVRKPPGGDTNDIFNLEVRHKVQANEIEAKQRVFKELQAYSNEIPNPSSKLCEIKPEISSADKLRNHMDKPNERSSNFFPLDKENIKQFEEENILSVDKLGDILKEELSVSPETDIQTEDDPELATKKYLIHNPITGEVAEMKVPPRATWAKASNIPKCQDNSLGLSSISRPSIRVRQPPGGVCSNIFY